MTWLVVEPYPSEKCDESSVGMMTFQIWWESHNPFHASSQHQPDYIIWSNIHYYYPLLLSIIRHEINHGMLFITFWAAMENPPFISGGSMIFPGCISPFLKIFPCHVPDYQRVNTQVDCWFSVGLFHYYNWDFWWINIWLDGFTNQFITARWCPLLSVGNGFKKLYICHKPVLLLLHYYSHSTTTWNMCLNNGVILGLNVSK